MLTKEIFHCRNFRMIISLVLFLSISLSIASVSSHASSVPRFDDVPEGHWAEKAVQDLRLLNLTDGIGKNRFGMGLEIKRSEFIAYLVRLMRWEQEEPESGSFSDNMDTSKWYYAYIETALAKGVLSKEEEQFRPEDPITREEMAIMIVKTLGYERLAGQIDFLGSDFDDVTHNTGYITIARDFGIITGVGGNQFKPSDSAKREEAAAMMIRMHEKLNQPLEAVHAFYAIRSYGQIDLISQLDSVSFGWSMLEYDSSRRRVVLNTSLSDKNHFYIPPAFSEPIYEARNHNVSTQLMVFADNNTLITPEADVKVPLLEYILADPKHTNQAIETIVRQINTTTQNEVSVSFDGVVIDFESMKGETLRESFIRFLEELKQALDKTDKALYVAVHPNRLPGQEYYDGYDYKAIGEIADQVILMAHDYYAKELTADEMQRGYTLTPLTPIDEVYYALKAITDKEKGVEDLNKVWLQISFDSVQWKIKDGIIMNKEPQHPGYEQIYQRILTDVEMNYSDLLQNPTIEFTDDEDETYNVLWYEDTRSVQDKITLAKMFGVNGISLWRLGNIPNYEEPDTKRIYLDVWQQILRNTSSSGVRLELLTYEV